MPVCGTGYVTCWGCGGSGRIWDEINQRYIACTECLGSGCVPEGSGPPPPEEPTG